MNTNALFLLIIVVIAILDVIYAMFVLPKLLAKNPRVTPKAAKTIRMACFSSAIMLTILGLVIYNLHLIH